jgi:ubiquinone/menaquinone biosynthesis C-methylase UbiE
LILPLRLGVSAVEYPVFEKRSTDLERIDTGDYTPAEYERFLQEIRFINRFTGDLRTLKKTLFREIERADLDEFSVLDVGAGSGELLGTVAEYARKTGKNAMLVGLDLNAVSAESIKRESSEISAIRADALRLPFEDGAFDYAICSLFTHHLTDEVAVRVLREMKRVSRWGIFVIDLHRHPAAYTLYKIFCVVFRISPLVRQDGSLSILRSFKPGELIELGERAGLKSPKVERHAIYRIVLTG